MASEEGDKERKQQGRRESEKKQARSIGPCIYGTYILNDMGYP